MLENVSKTGGEFTMRSFLFFALVVSGCGSQAIDNNTPALCQLDLASPMSVSLARQTDGSALSCHRSGDGAIATAAFKRSEGDRVHVVIVDLATRYATFDDCAASPTMSVELQELPDSWLVQFDGMCGSELLSGSLLGSREE